MNDEERNSLKAAAGNLHAQRDVDAGGNMRVRLRSRHTYTIDMQPLPRGWTKVTIAANGIEIGGRKTRMRHWFALICSPNWEFAVASVQREIPLMRAQADRCDRLHLREPGILAQLDWEMAAWPAACRDQVRADRERDIADGVYAAHAKSTRESIAQAEALLNRLLHAQYARRGELFVKTWTQRRDYNRRYTPWETLVDIVEITLP